MNASVLDPRPDSETLVAAVLAQYPEPDTVVKIADLGTGSGCLLLSILSERPGAEGVGVDISGISAVDCARKRTAIRSRGACKFQSERLGVSALDGTFDIVVSNPPYIPTAAIDDLAPEVAQARAPRRSRWRGGRPRRLSAYCSGIAPNPQAEWPRSLGDRAGARRIRDAYSARRRYPDCRSQKKIWPVYRAAFSAVCDILVKSEKVLGIQPINL